MQKTFSILLVLLFHLTAPSQTPEHQTHALLPGFSLSPSFQEQVLTFTFEPDVRVHINAPSVEEFNPTLLTALAFYALPNGNTIDQTIGKKREEGDDWHYDIQHIGAQTRFIRLHVRDYNFVTIYLEAQAATVPLSWPTWRKVHTDHPALVKSIVDSVIRIFSLYSPYVILSSHSGGGGFIFSYLDYASIPSEVKRIAFLDSDYNYDETYGMKLCEWLKAAPDHFLSVLAYNDSIALLQGKPFVSPTGGTWYRTNMLASFLAKYFPFSTVSDSAWMRHTALNGRIKIILKQNPAREIYHTTQVEFNGFIHTMLSGTAAEGVGYEYYGPRAYSQFIQSGRTLPRPLHIPPRKSDSRTGSEFMASLSSLTFDQRERAIYDEISNGNIPDFMRSLKRIQSTFLDADAKPHTVVYEVMPDYLCIGTNDDFCRIPMGPFTAQRLANLFGASLPTSVLADDIYSHAEVRLSPVTYTPVGNQNELVSTFKNHNTAIEAQRIAAGKPLGALIGGIKKDVVISSKIIDSTRPGHVVIYGWHTEEGKPIQPLTNIHNARYVDYSHGIRFINKELLVDNIVMTVSQVLTDTLLYKSLSNESGPMKQTTYSEIIDVPVFQK